MQCRITTEDPANNFAPDFGKVALILSPGGMGVRLDAGTGLRAMVTPNYDSMLVKLTCKEKNLDA